jgi:L-histidine Nalpha-methyltransferase
MENRDILITPEKKITLSNCLPPPNSGEAVAEIIQGISSVPPYIPSRFFYDGTGSALFEEITRLPEYYPTRTEKAILKDNADVIAGELENADIVELGSGDCSKISILFDAIPAGIRETIRYIPVDVSPAAIVKSAETLSRKYPEISIHGMLADFLKHLGDIPGENRKLICFFGSTIGNLDPVQTSRLLLNISNEMQEGDQFLLGLDIVKDIRVLEDAYNDSHKVTAAFNKNILNVVNQHAKTNFDPRLFDHLAFYNQSESRIEMHLKAMKEMDITSPYLPDPVHLEKGGTIHTENSRKFTSGDTREISGLTGLKLKQVYSDNRRWFSLVHLVK